MRSVQAINDTRKDLLIKMTEKSSADQVVTRSISFENDDVPKFLERLKRFKQASAKANHRVG